MSPYAPEVAEMIQRVGGRELLDRLSDADLPSMLRASGTAARRRARSFESSLVEAHRQELALVFAEAGRRGLMNDRRFLLHERVSKTAPSEPRPIEAWHNRATDELAATKRYTAEYHALLKQCLEPSLKQPDPAALFAASMRLQPTDLIRVAAGIDLRRRSLLQRAGALFERVSTGGSSGFARSISAHSLGLVQVQMGKLPLALDSFRRASMAVERALIQSAYWAALASVVENQEELRAADRALIDADEGVVTEAIDGLRHLAMISAWPRVHVRGRHMADSLGPATRRICNGIA